MKKIFIFLFVVGLLFITNSVFAENSTNITSQTETINQLKGQIQLLQNQIVDLKTEVQSVKKELEFTRVLAKGAKGEDVKQLQEFLKNFTGVYPNGSIDGHFGPVTAMAVKKFQKQNGINPIGTVGPKTQEKLKMLNDAIPTTTTTPTTSVQPSGQVTTTPVITPATPGEPTSAVPTPVAIGPVPSATPCKTPTKTEVQSTFIKVLSPNGGEKWKIGGTYTIKYSAKEIVGNKALLIYLEKGYDAPSTKTGANSSSLIGLTTNLESYTYTVPSNASGWPGLGNNYKITIMVEGSYSSCGAISYIGDSSDETFSIVAGQVNVLPATSAGSTIPGGTTTITPSSGGGYGVSTAPVQVTPNTVSTQDKIASMQKQIRVLQEKVNTTTDIATKDSLTAQINVLTAQLQTISPTTPIPVWKPALVLGQDPISLLYAQHSALTKQFNSTTDPAARNVLWAQQAAVSNQILALTPPEPTTQKRISEHLEEISASQDKLNKSNPDAPDDWVTSRIATLKAQIQILENNPTTPANQLLFAQIIDLQNQLNSTTDTATRDSLVAQILELKKQMK